MPDNPTLVLFRSAIGPVNSEYYLPILTRFESLGRSGLSWNWAAGLYTLNWMVYRRLWRQAAIYLATLICVLATAAIIQLVTQPSLPVQIAGVLTLLGFAVGIPGLFGNAWLYADIRNRLTQAIAASKTMAEAGLTLSQQASTRQAFIRQVIANATVVSLAVATYLLLPGAEKVAVGDTKPVKTAPQVIAPPALPPFALAATTASSVAPIASAPTFPPVVAASAPVVLAAPPQTPTQLANLAPKSTPPLNQPGIEMPVTNTITTPASKINSPTPTVESNKPMAKKREKQELAATTKARAPDSDSDVAPRIVYFVNVGLFSKEQNASAAVSQLAAAGVIGTTQLVDVGSKKLTRVRSGPFETRADATEAAVKIRLLNLEAKVFAQRQQ